MRQLDNEYMNNPHDYLISERIKALRSYFGNNETHDCLILGKGSRILVRHIDNLFLTYGVSQVLSVADIIFRKKVS